MLLCFTGEHFCATIYFLEIKLFYIHIRDSNWDSTTSTFALTLMYIHMWCQCCSSLCMGDYFMHIHTEWHKPVYVEVISTHLWIYDVSKPDMVVREDTWVAVDEVKSKFHCWYVTREVKLWGLGHLQLNGQVLFLSAYLCAVLLLQG